MTNKFRRTKSTAPSVAVTVVAPDTPTPKRTVIFEWARIAGATAQVLMLLIVAGGYYFTVRPLFQNQLLEEKAAELELEVQEKETALLSVEPSIRAAEEAIESLELQKAELLSGIEKAENRQEEQTRRLEDILWKQFVASLDVLSRFDGLDGSIIKNLSSWEIEPFGFEQTAPLDPRQQLLDALASIENDSDENERVARFVARAQKIIDAYKNDLRCEKLDVPALEFQHGKDYEAINERFYRHDELAGLKGAAKIKREAEIRLEKMDAIFTLRDRYSKRIHSIVDSCEGKRRRIIEFMREPLLPL